MARVGENFFDYGNLQKLKRIQMGEWGGKGKNNLRSVTHVERKQGLVRQSDSMTLRINQ